MRTFVLLSLVFFLFAGTVQASEAYYSTYRGRVFLTGSEPLVQVMIQAGDGSVYSLSGPLLAEMRQLSRFSILVTGKVSAAVYPNSQGNILVEAYSLAMSDSDAERGMVLGTLRRSRDQLVMVGDDQVIYLIENPEVLQYFTYMDSRALLVGMIVCSGHYEGLITITSFKILGESNLS